MMISHYFLSSAIFTTASITDYAKSNHGNETQRLYPREFWSEVVEWGSKFDQIITDKVNAIITGFCQIHSLLDRAANKDWGRWF